MDGVVFDDLLKRLTQTRLRRGDALRGVLASATALAGLGLPAEVTQADRNKRHHTQFQCKAAGTSCLHKPKKGSKPPRSRLCKGCCETFRKVNKKAGVCCIAEGGSCDSAAQCCLGSCSAGHCQPTVTQIPPPPTPCVPTGGTCSVDAECCPRCCGASVNVSTGVVTPFPIPCTGGVCCAPLGGGCDRDAECCPQASGAPVACSGTGNAAGGVCYLTSPPGTCVAYGGSCSSTAECCASVPCNGGLCRFN